MMGTKIRRFAPLPHDLSLEELVPEDHLYRRLEATLDLSFVRKLVAPLYANGGRPSVDSVVFFKLQLVMFFEDLRSERLLMRVVSESLSLRWYLGYDLLEPLPHHSSLTRIRNRLGLEVFRRFFERIVEECFDTGLVWGEELYFDSTKVEANASIDSTRSRSLVGDRLEEHLAGVFPEDTPPTNDDDEHSGVISGFVGPEGEQRRALAQTNALGHRWIAGAGRQERESVRWGYKRMADMRVSTTDPDASPMHQKNKSSGKLGYLTHYVVDGGKARVVLNVLVTGRRSRRTSPCGRCSLGAPSVGACVRVRLPGMRPTARGRTQRPWRRRAYVPTPRWPSKANAPPFSPLWSSPTTQRRITTPALQEKPCAVGATTIEGAT